MHQGIKLNREQASGSIRLICAHVVGEIMDDAVRECSETDFTFMSISGGARGMGFYWMGKVTSGANVLQVICYHLLITRRMDGHVPVVVVGAFSDELRRTLAHDGRLIMCSRSGYEWLVVSHEGDLVGFIEGREVGYLPRAS